MVEASTVDETLARLLRARCALGAVAGAPDELPLGTGGLGMDSIAIAELLIECAERFGVAVPIDLLAGEPLTVGRLAEHLRRTAGGPPHET